MSSKEKWIEKEFSWLEILLPISPSTKWLALLPWLVLMARGMAEICGVWKRRDAVKRKENRGGAQVKGPTLTWREFFKNGIHQVTEHPVVCYKKNNIRIHSWIAPIILECTHKSFALWNIAAQCKSLRINNATPSTFNKKTQSRSASSKYLFFGS